MTVFSEIFIGKYHKVVVLSCCFLGTHDLSDLNLEAFFEDENSSKNLTPVNVFPEVQMVGKLVVLSSGQVCYCH